MQTLKYWHNKEQEEVTQANKEYQSEHRITDGELDNQADTQVWGVNLPAGLQLPQGIEQEKQKHPTSRGTKVCSKASRMGKRKRA
jgi:hypothetical protein